MAVMIGRGEGNRHEIRGGGGGGGGDLDSSNAYAGQQSTCLATEFVSQALEKEW
jgi:hypothetical protein